MLTRDDAVAYLVDRAADLVIVPDSAIRPAEEAGTLNGCVAAELVIGDRLVHALAPEAPADRAGTGPGRGPDAGRRRAPRRPAAVRLIRTMARQVPPAPIRATTPPTPP